MQNNNTAVILDDLQIAQVEALANYLSIEQVAGYFNLSASDFLDLQKKDERVLRAYRKGKIRGVCKVALLLWEQMEAGNVTALIFFLKTRGGWSERPFAETEDNAHKFKNIKLICKEFEAEKAKSRQLANLKQFSKEETAEISQSIVSLPVGLREEANKGKTLEVIAKKAGVSRATAEQYDAIQRKGTEEQKAEVASGNSSIKKVYTNIRKAERLETNKVTEWPKVFIPIPLGVMVTKEATEVMARL
ncbi:hypothetical protein Megvenef_01161 [Candidatus Megaera venefica]|uniref:Uncharacterized protein n=1 Tax=Candidatus Megaera venefica TaxID=2055910 RepID=A0ABU5NDC4_9RICK|nr:hypothetical protein [Candidatus Megaera venefica]MEA0971188.1 hypothetical protein [Candidatus Megaera venefica]